MARLQLIIKGEPQDHLVYSDSLSDSEAAEQLASVGALIGRTACVELPWLTTMGGSVRLARIVSDEQAVPASAGRPIMGDLANEAF